MQDKKIMEKLERELQVPELVQKRVKSTLDDIRLVNFGEHTTTENRKSKKKGQKLYRWSKKTVAAAVTSIILLSGVTATAAVSNWGLDDGVWLGPFRASKEVQENMEEKGVVTTPLQEVEHGGVKVALLQCVTDNEHYSCLFRVTVPKKLAKEYSDFEIVETKGYSAKDEVHDMGYEIYYDETETGNEKIMFYALSGTHAQIREYNEGTSKEYRMLIDESAVTEADYKKSYMTFTFENYGLYDEQGEFELLVEDTWEFQWKEQLVTDKKTYEINKHVGVGYYERSNSILKSIKITPIAVTLTHDIEASDVCKDEYGNGEQLIIEPMMPTAIEMQDGTVLELVNHYSGPLLTSSGENIYECNSVATPIQMIEPEKVAALHFGSQLRLELK